MKIAVIGETKQVYFISEKILKFLGYSTYGESLFAVGFAHSGEDVFKEIYLDGVKYTWESQGLIGPYCSGAVPSVYGVIFPGQLDNFSDYEKDIIQKLRDGSEICAVSEYNVDEKSKQKRIREKKLERITK